MIHTSKRIKETLQSSNSQGYKNNQCNNNNRSIKGDNKIKCIYANVRSIVNKIDELELCVLEDKPDIIALTET